MKIKSLLTVVETLQLALAKRFEKYFFRNHDSEDSIIAFDGSQYLTKAIHSIQTKNVY